MTDESVYYFAFGSNADPDRFRSRVCDWRSRRAARLDDHRLRFASSVQSEGGGGAVIDEAPGEVVYGVLYEITPAQLEAMDREEFDPKRDTHEKGFRTRVTVSTDDGPCEAECYVVRDDGGWRAPSERYVGFIVRGLRDVGHPPEALDRVRRAAARSREG